MRDIKLNDSSFHKILSEAERILKSGGIVICPTDTVYGILGDAKKHDAIKKIYAIKQRPADKKFPIFVKDVAMARKFAYISDDKAKFLEKIWPGPVTVVFHHKGELPEILIEPRNTIGMRVPRDPFLLELLSRMNSPLAQTSANVSRHPPAKNIKDIKYYFGKGKVKPDLVLDGGEISGHQSTVVDFTGKEPIILRTGLVTKSKLDLILNSMRG